MDLQRCPQCKNDLALGDFPKSHRGVNGKYCRKCHYDQQRRRILKRDYGLVPEDITTIYQRQHGRCLGCQNELPNNYVIDHNHETGVVRGLLCRPCNLVLGLVKEQKDRLTRLRLYLDRDPKKTSIYVIGSLRNTLVPQVAQQLRFAGFDVWDEWVSAGPEADDYWQRYEQDRGRTFIEALRGKAAQNVFFFDKAQIDLADIGVLVMPAGKSGHLELGYMAAQGKPTYILQDGTPDRFDVMPQFATGVFTSVTALVAALRPELIIETPEQEPVGYGSGV